MAKQGMVLPGNAAKSLNRQEENEAERTLPMDPHSAPFQVDPHRDRAQCSL
jgi:hypothetical protein